MTETLAAPRGEQVRVEPCPKRVRVVVGGAVVADSAHPLLLLEAGHLPVYYFPRGDVRADVLEPSSTTSYCPHKGEASYYSLRVGEVVVEDAAWSYESPLPGREDIASHLAFYWTKADAWFEEDDEVYVHPRDPYHRVDVLNSSRHVRVAVGGETVADSRRPRLVFETGLPTRYYLPRADVRTELLVPSPTTSQCPYKGVASYWSIQAGGQRVEDGVWSYRFPIPECPKIEGLLAFFNERVDIWVDGELQARPQTPWS